MIRNLHWYDANATRGYPLADQATSVSTDGFALPSNILTDLNLRYPSVLGTYPFIASVCVTPSLVSLTIQVATDPDDTTTYAPVASFSALRETVEEGRHYALESQYPGVAGWIVFGLGINEPYTGRFGVRAGLLAPRAARPYKPLPVQSLGLLYDRTPLTGIVNIRGEQPLTVTKEEREVDGVLRDVVVLRLAQPTAEADTLTTQQSVFEAFSGPCGKRPESGNCGSNAPIQFINAVSPNCEGKLYIEFRGCARIARVSEECGVMLDCALGLIDVCKGGSLPAADGTLSNEYTDECPTSGNNESESVSDSGPPQYIDNDSETAPTGADLPYSEDFSDGLAQGWTQQFGTWAVAPLDDGYVYGPNVVYANAFRNIAMLDRADSSTIGRSYTTTVKLSPGLKCNAGIVVNYRPGSAVSGRTLFFLVEIDYDTQEFRIRRSDGIAALGASAMSQLNNLQLEQWYQINVTTTPGAGGSVTITGNLTTIGGGPSASVTLTVPQSLYQPDTGRPGLHADRSKAAFGSFQIAVV